MYKKTIILPITASDTLMYLKKNCKYFKFRENLFIFFSRKAYFSTPLSEFSVLVGKVDTLGSGTVLTYFDCVQIIGVLLVSLLTIPVLVYIIKHHDNLNIIATVVTFAFLVLLYAIIFWQSRATSKKFNQILERIINQ